MSQLRQALRLGTGIGAALLLVLIIYLLFWSATYQILDYTFSSASFWRIVLVFLVTVLVHQLLRERPPARYRRPGNVFAQELRERKGKRRDR